MLRTFLQFWGGIFYLLNKVCLSWSEGANYHRGKKFWRVSSWVVYIVGLPAWVIIFFKEKNWMLAAVESGGAPAMVLGLIIALQGKERPGLKWLDHVAQVAAILGIAFSFWYFGGITTVTQICELGTVAGFLLGTYLLAKQGPSGYIWFMVMNVSNGALMALEHYPMLVIQQILSVGFVVDAWFTQRRKSKVIVMRPRQE